MFILATLKQKEMAKLTMRSCSAFEHIISGLVVLLPSNLLTIESTNHKTSKSTFIYDILIK